MSCTMGAQITRSDIRSYDCQIPKSNQQNVWFHFGCDWSTRHDTTPGQRSEAASQTGKRPGIISIVYSVLIHFLFPVCLSGFRLVAWFSCRHCQYSGREKQTRTESETQHYSITSGVRTEVFFFCLVRYIRWSYRIFYISEELVFFLLLTERKIVKD